LVAEVVRERLLFAGVLQIIGGMTVSLLAGTLLGLLAGVICVQALNRHLLPDHFHFPFVLMILFASFSGANYIHHESGLLAATVMGMYLAERGGQTTRL